jgi:hypothetical protein
LEVRARRQKAGRREMGCATEALDAVVATIDDLVEAVEVEDSYRKMAHDLVMEEKRR